MTHDDKKDPAVALEPFKKPKRRKVVELTQYSTHSESRNMEQLSIAEPSASYSTSSAEEVDQNDDLVPTLFKTTIVNCLMNNEILVEQINNNSDDRVQQGVYSELLEEAIISNLEEHHEIAMKLLLESRATKQFAESVFSELKQRVLCALEEDKTIAKGKDKNDH